MPDRSRETQLAASHDDRVKGAGWIGREIRLFQREQSIDEGLPVGLGHFIARKLRKNDRHEVPPIGSFADDLKQATNSRQNGR